MLTPKQLRDRYYSVDAFIEYIESQMKLASITEKSYSWHVPLFLREKNKVNDEAIESIKNHFKVWGFDVHILCYDPESYFEYEKEYCKINFSWYE